MKKLKEIQALLLANAKAIQSLVDIHRELSIEFDCLKIELGDIADDVPSFIALPDNKKNIYIFIDCGHGGLNPQTKQYTTAPAKQFQHNGLNLHTADGFIYEGVFNRAVGNNLANKLKETNIPFEFVSHDWQEKTNTQRIYQANEKHKQLKGYDCLYISIHADATPLLNDNRPNGISVFVGNNASANSKRAGNLLAKYLKKNMTEFAHRRQTNDRDYWHHPQKLGVLELTTMPAVLSENGFFTNPKDALSMVKENTIERFAQSHFEMIVEYFGL
jgi:N-acetylmuramoyl-L-alanine amidase